MRQGKSHPQSTPPPMPRNARNEARVAANDGGDFGNFQTVHEGNTVGTIPQWQIDLLSNSPKGTQSLYLPGFGWLGGAEHVGDPGWTLGVGTDSPTTNTGLKTSIDKLTNSTDSLNSTMGDLLSPYYNQDPRTSHIGFRSQGMATGGEVTVPGGYSANDNMMAQIPVASGEIIAVRRPGGSSGGGSSQVVNINQYFAFSGTVNRDEFARTAYQGAQSAARQLAAVR
jgi:hypothetical protein